MTHVALARRSEAGSIDPPEMIELTPAFVARYELLELLGTGACGAVYRARDRTLSRAVAIKFLHRIEYPAAMDRFMREARLMASISHTGVVALYDFEMLGAHAYITMEMVSSGSLRQHLEESGAIAAAEAVRLLGPSLAGLGVCHDAGMIHRDIKPENLLIGERGLKLADFGLASWRDASRVLTGEGELLGTPRYMAPEVVSGEPARITSDIYAMGAVLFEMLAGSQHFAASRYPSCLTTSAAVQFRS